MSGSGAGQPSPRRRKGASKPRGTSSKAEQRALKQITGDAIRKIEADKVAMAQKCAAQFNVGDGARGGLANLIALYGEAAQPALAKATLDRALASTTLTVTVRANVLSRLYRPDCASPNRPNATPGSKRYVDELDRLQGDARRQDQPRTPG